LKCKAGNEGALTRLIILPFSGLVNLTAEKLIYLMIFFLPLMSFIDEQLVLNYIKHGIFRIFTIVLFFYTCIYIAEETSRRTLLREKNYNPFFLILYVATAFVSVMLALMQSEMEIGRAAVALTTLPLLICLVYIIPFWINSVEKIQNCLRVYFYSMAYSIVVGFVQVFLSLGGSRVFRIASVLNDPNIYSRYLIVGLFFIIFQYYYKDFSIISKKFSTYLAVASLIQIILSFSRSGYLTLFIGLIIFSFGLKNTKIKIGLIFSIVTISALSIVFLSTQRFSQSSTFMEASSFNRVLLILGGLNMIQHHWLIGIGYTNFQYIFAKYYVKNTIGMSPQAFDTLGFATSIHNWFIEVFAEQGIIGLIGFVGIFASAALRLKQLRRRIQNPSFLIIVRGFLLFIFVFLFQGLFYHSFISQFAFWFLFGLLVATLSVGLNPQINENIEKQ
jgi:teichuronic acid biosynthesis protein TuaE